MHPRFTTISISAHQLRRVQTIRRIGPRIRSWYQTTRRAKSPSHSTATPRHACKFLQVPPNPTTSRLGSYHPVVNNRGYATSRGMWPWHFAFLNNDCLWVLDETQLMGVGLSTTAQLQAFRNQLQTFGPSRTLWMSATLDQKALDTVDASVDRASLTLSEHDLGLPQVVRRLNGKKAIQRLNFDVSDKKYAQLLAGEILSRHDQGNRMILVVLNRVIRAQSVFKELKKIIGKRGDAPKILLIHGRFRPAERIELNRCLREDIPKSGGIVVATQTVEAGVDLDAEILITELAPWSSLVQRFGRCNRSGLHPEAKIYWINIPDKEAAPYNEVDLASARNVLADLSDVSISNIRGIAVPTLKISNHVLRRKDLLELFDTTPDLTGADIDISRFIRDGDDKDIQVYWRSWVGETDGVKPPDDLPKPQAEELCNVGISGARKFLEKADAWRWDFVTGEWMSTVHDKRLWPGIVLMLPAHAGGYDSLVGWTGNHQDFVAPFSIDDQRSSPADNSESDVDSFILRFVPLVKHSSDLVRHLERLKNLLATYEDLPWEGVYEAGRWHDAGKAHPEFQSMLLSHLSQEERAKYPGLWAKSDYDFFHRKNRSRMNRRFFRHELASALAMLKTGYSDLSAYLACCHHGKVRLSIRSQAGEKAPDDIARFARGVWEGDRLPKADLGGGSVMSEIQLTLSYMELGRHPETGDSWLERALRLLEKFGPFRLVLLETLVRVADWRASIEEGKNEQ